MTCLSGERLLTVGLLVLKCHIFFSFFKTSVAHSKMAECILSYLNMVAQTQETFCDNKYFTATAHLRFQCESLVLNINSTTFCSFLQLSNENSDV